MSLDPNYDSNEDFSDPVNEDRGEQQQPEQTQQPQRSETALHEQLTRTAMQAGASKAMTEVMKNPQIATLLQAQAQGKRVKMVLEDDTDAHNPPEEMPKLPADANNEQVAEYMGKMMDFHGKNLLKQVESRVGSIMDKKIQPVESMFKGLEVRDARSDLDSLASKFPDVVEYVDAMQELAEAHPSLKMSQLYVLAKTEAGQPLSRNKSTDSERPTTDTARPVGGNRPRKTPLPPGYQGMRMALSEAKQRLGRRLQNASDEDV